MKQILNGLFYFVKYFLFFGALAITVYIITQMYDRLGKNMMESISVFLPYFLLCFFFALNILLHQQSVNKNLFYNITCTLVFATVILAGFRAIYDSNMILRAKLARGINFNYFDSFIPQMKVMVYGLSVANLFLMFTGNSREKKKKVIKDTPVEQNHNFQKVEKEEPELIS